MKVSTPLHQTRHVAASLAMAVGVAATLAFPEVAMATSTTFGGADGKACGFLSNLRGLLNIASVAVVTIAVIFAGYQIAFAHKRLSDVAPILLGGLLIGAAGQIAKWIMPDNTGDCATTTTYIIDKMNGIDQHVQFLASYVA